jgi:hypothetical protein
MIFVQPTSTKFHPEEIEKCGNETSVYCSSGGVLRLTPFKVPEFSDAWITYVYRGNSDLSSIKTKKLFVNFDCKNRSSMTIVENKSFNIEGSLLDNQEAAVQMRVAPDSIEEMELSALCYDGASYVKEPVDDPVAYADLIWLNESKSDKKYKSKIHKDS